MAGPPFFPTKLFRPDVIAIIARVATSNHHQSLTHPALRLHPSPGQQGVPVTTQHRSDVLCIGNDAVRLNLRCSNLRKHGWNVLSSGSGFEGVLQFSRQRVDAVVVDLDDDGTEAALIIGELKRLRPEVPVIMLATDEKLLAPGATQLADAVIMKSQEDRSLIDALRVFLPPRGKSRHS